MQTVEGRLGGFKIIELPPPEPDKYGTRTMTDEQLREVVVKKFQSLISAFRSFDTDGNIVKIAYRLRPKVSVSRTSRPRRLVSSPFAIAQILERARPISLHPHL